ncbi:hypothetical protein DYB26_016554, partial [Aphanomyces astaci]
SRRPNKTSDGKYSRRLYVAVMGQLTWAAHPMDQELTSNFRRDVIAMLAAANDMAVAAQASARFHTAVAAPASLSADLRSIVYSIHVRTTSEPDAAFEHPPPVFETSVFIEEKLHVLGALGRFPSVELKTRALEWAAVAADGSTVTWEYVQAKWDALSAQYSQIVVGCILCVSIANYQLNKPPQRSKHSWSATPKAPLPPAGVVP